MKTRVGIATAAIVTAIAATPTAHADEYDFVIDLDGKGIYYSSISTMIDIGKLTCSRLRAGSPETAGAPASAAGYSGNEVGIIVVAATNNMCPDQWPTLNAWVGAQQTPTAAPQTQQLDPPPPPSSNNASLNVATPISRPACDGTGIVVLGSVTTPGQYSEGVKRLLDANPGASYLRTDQSCPSLRRATADGNPIYAVYRLAGKSESAVCDAVHAAGGSAYGKWLDSTTAPDFIIPC